MKSLVTGLIAAAAVSVPFALAAAVPAAAQQGAPHHRRQPRPGQRPVLVGGQERRHRRRPGHEGAGRLPRARNLRHGGHEPAHRRRRQPEARRAHRVDPRFLGARPGDPEGGRGRHSGDLDEFRLRRLEEARRAAACGPGRDRCGPHRRREAQGDGRQGRHLRQPGGRQRLARPALQGLRRRLRRQGHGAAGLERSDRHPRQGQGGARAPTPPSTRSWRSAREPPASPRSRPSRMRARPACAWPRSTSRPTS